MQATLILAGYDELTGALIVSVVLADKRPVTALSDANVGHKMQISTGGKRLMTSVLREPLRDGSFQMTSSSQAEVGALVAQLASGPATLVIDVAE